MLLLLTIFLVLVGAVMLIIGFIQDSLVPIYISIGCSVAAAVVLVAFSRMSRRQGVRVVSLPREELTPEVPAPAPDGAVSESITVLGPTAAEAEPVIEEVGPAHEAVLIGGPLADGEGEDTLDADEVEAEPAPAAAANGLLARAEAGMADTVGTGEELTTVAGAPVAAGAAGLTDDATTEITAAATTEEAGATSGARRAAASRGTSKAGAKKAAPRKAATRTTAAKAGATKKTATKATPAKKAATRTTSTTGARAGATKKAATKATPAKKAATRTTGAKAGATKKTATKATAAKKSTGGTGTRRRSGS